MKRRLSALKPANQEVIGEFQIVTSGAIAEFGRASSGGVNIIITSGTNARLFPEPGVERIKREQQLKHLISATYIAQ